MRKNGAMERLFDRYHAAAVYRRDARRASAAAAR